MKTVDDIIDDICKAEGSNEENGYLTPGDRGGRTTYGISERSHPAAWRDGPPSLDVCKAIYREEYVKPWEWVGFDPLREQLVDFSVTSGHRRATYWLQRAMGLQADGIAGPDTKAAVNACTYIPYERVNAAEHVIICSQAVAELLNNALVAARLAFIDQMTDAEKSQKKFEEGWESRALSFLILS